VRIPGRNNFNFKLCFNAGTLTEMSKFKQIYTNCHSKKCWFFCWSVFHSYWYWNTKQIWVYCYCCYYKY